MTAEETSTKSIFITGASGYLGRLLVERLVQHGMEVVASDLRPVDLRDRLDEVTYVALDIRDPKAVSEAIGRQKVDTVVHLAAIVTPPKGQYRQLAYDVDVRGTRYVLDACLLHGVKQIIVTSSGAAYGYYADNPALIKEDAPLRGNEIFPYSHHKRLVELMLAETREKHPELEQLIFRPGTILGKGTKNQITAIFERPVVMGLRGASSPFVFIWDEDVVSCIEKGILEDKTGIYNLAGDGTLTLREIAMQLGKSYVELPAPLVQTGLSILDQFHVAPYGPEQTLFLLYRPVLGNQALKEEFGFTPKSTQEVFELYKAALS